MQVIMARFCYDCYGRMLFQVYDLLENIHSFLNEMRLNKCVCVSFVRDFCVYLL